MKNENAKWACLVTVLDELDERIKCGVGADPEDLSRFRRGLAAAPDLLAALKIAAGCITGKAINDGRLDQVIAAIAKAEGK